ncbi:uncharacterized protein LOC131061631 [Cryptomeria japonica]|uniref:uncharacterized protein LOC131061631 n=1 Tax=Cryptomeria japonica TaxID=3369 RepID=UPI0027DA7951|nr:uncharacterized protein LOC131061631 [Cryptomeria japonica]
MAISKKEKKMEVYENLEKIEQLEKELMPVQDEAVACEIIKKLLFVKKQGSINVKKASAGDKYGRNVLHVAAFLGRKELCRFLLDLDRNMIDSKDRDGQTAIYYAVAGPHDEPSVLGEFISRKQRRNQAFVKDFSQTTPLHVAAARGNIKMVDKLLSEISAQECNDYVEAADVLGQTALHKAASGGHGEIVKKLLASGAHPLKQRDCDGKTAVHFAAQSDGEDSVTIAKLLLDKCESDKQKSLLLFASAVGIGLRSNSSLEKYLEEEKREILEKSGEENLLRVAATLGDIDMTREFITRGANIATIRNEKWIHTLPEDEKEKVRDVLKQIDNIVEQGTDKPALRDDLGRTPFAIGLAALFLNPYVKSPVTVGISGEWGMGKSSVMVQTESILLKTAAELAFPNSFKKEKFPGASESKLSVTGQARRRKIANAIDAERGDGPKIIDSIGMSIKQVKNFTAKATEPRNCSRLHKFWNALLTIWNESAPPEDFDKYNDFLENYQPKFPQIFKSVAIMDRRDMFEEEEESGSGNQRVGETPWEENSLQGTTPSILTVQYNAWHYRNETEAWAGLAVEITKELEATMTVAHKLRTSWTYNWRNRKNSICFGVILPFFLALMVAIWFSTIVWFLLDTSQRKDLKKFKYGGLPASMIVAAWGVGKSVISFVKPISSQVVDYICLPDHSQKLGYHQKVIDDINFLKDQLCYKPSWKWEVFAFIWCCITWSWDENYVPGTKIPKMPPASRNNLRIIVFVDDLDRCEENVILQVLSAVNLVLATCEINVILSMEKSMIQRAIIIKYGNNNSNANNKSNEELADNYLRKIVQLPLHLSDPSDSESRDFLQSQLGRKRSTDPAAEKEKCTSYGRRKANPKFQIGTSDANKPKLGRGETKKESGAKQQRALSISDTEQQGSGKTEEQETIKKPEGSGVADATFEIDEQPTKIEKAGRGETKKDLPESGAKQQTTVSILGENIPDTFLLIS